MPRLRHSAATVELQTDGHDGEAPILDMRSLLSDNLWRQVVPETPLSSADRLVELVAKAFESTIFLV